MKVYIDYTQMSALPGKMKRTVLTFNRRGFPALALAQEEDLDVRLVLLELCPVEPDLLVDGVADLLRVVFGDEAPLALCGGLVDRRAEGGGDGVGERAAAGARRGMGGRHGVCAEVPRGKRGGGEEGEEEEKEKEEEL